MLGDDGQKMSKSLRNYPDVNEVFDRYGSDAMRWFLMASPVLRGGNLVVSQMPVDRRIHSDSCRAARLHRRIGGRRGDDRSGAERESFVSAELDDGRRRNERGKCWTRRRAG